MPDKRSEKEHEIVSTLMGFTGKKKKKGLRKSVVAIILWMKLL